MQMRCVIAQANVLDPMACKGQAQDERGGHADWHARRARKDGAVSAAGPSVEVMVHAARLRPGKVLVPQVAVEFQRHLGHVQPALRDDKAEWIAQWEGSQHHIARRVREEGQSVMQVNAAERVWQCARRGINRSIACERVPGSRGGEYRRLASVALILAATPPRNWWLRPCACASHLVYPAEYGPAAAARSVHRAAFALPKRQLRPPAPHQLAAAPAAARGTPHSCL